MLTIRCKKHPKYTAKRLPKATCFGCSLLYVLRHQHEKDGERVLGSLNPYQYLGDLQQSCEDLEVLGEADKVRARTKDRNDDNFFGRF